MTIAQTLRVIAVREGLPASKLPELEFAVACRANWSRAQFLTHLADAATSPDIDAWEAVAAKLSLGYPTEYVIGCAQFCDVTLDIEEGVFVPRTETEQLVDRAVRRLGEGFGGTRPLVGFEPCSGSGAISLAMAHRLPASRMIGVDVDPVAVRSSLRSASRMGLADRVTFARANVLCLWDDVRRWAPAGFDFIVSNPPYVTGGRLPGAVESSPREPVHALYGGPDGLLFYRVIVSRAARALRPGGLLFLEIDDGLETAILNMLYAHQMTDCRWSTDLQGQPRFVEAKQVQ